MENIAYSFPNMSSPASISEEVKDPVVKGCTEIQLVIGLEWLIVLNVELQPVICVFIIQVFMNREIIHRKS